MSNRGRVRSERRVVLRSDGKTQTIPERILSTPPDGKGHPRVVLFCEVGTNGVTRNVHQLVLEAFVGPCPPEMECCHGNGVKTDNRVENLRWDTRRENKLDNTRQGVNRNAAKTHCIRGHEFTTENTYVWACKTTASRICRKCAALRASGQAFDPEVQQKPVAPTRKPKTLPTHCRHGHAYTPENTRIVTKHGKTARECRTCVRERKRAWRADNNRR